MSWKRLLLGASLPFCMPLMVVAQSESASRDVEPSMSKPAPGSALASAPTSTSAPASSPRERNAAADAPIKPASHQHTDRALDSSAFTSEFFSYCDSCQAQDYPPFHLWFEGDALFAWIRGSRLPSIATLGNTTDAFPAALGQAGTRVVLGDSIANDQMAHGFRLRAGARFDELHGVEIGGFYLEQLQTRGLIESSSSPNNVLARPYFDTFLNREAAFRVGAPGALAGTVASNLKTDFFGAELNVVEFGGPMDAFVGFRFLNLTDELNIQTRYTSLANGQAFFNGAALAANSQTTVVDSFRVSNQFYGGQIGVRGRLGTERINLDLRSSVGLGTTVQSAFLAGTTNVTTPTGQRVSPTSLLVQNSNTGRFEASPITAIVEANMNLNIRITSWLSCHAGYNVLYWSRVGRAADQVDRGINTRSVPISNNFNGSASTRPILGGINQNDLWMHGLNVGLTVRY